MSVIPTFVFDGISGAEDVAERFSEGYVAIGLGMVLFFTGLYMTFGVGPVLMVAGVLFVISGSYEEAEEE